jgi:Protein of unknown function (DUF3486)
MINKPHPRGVIASLPAGHRALIDRWLFDENRSYDRVQRLCLDRLKLKIHRNTLGRYFQRQSRRRALERIAASAATANAAMRKFQEHPADYYQVLDNMIGQIAFDRALDRDKPDFDGRTVIQFAKLLLDGKKFSFARQKWEFAAAKACLRHLPQLKAIAADDSLDEDARVERARIRLFGSAPK